MESTNKNFYLYTDKLGNIVNAQSMDVQSFYLKKDAVIVCAENEVAAIIKYREFAVNDFYPLNLNNEE